MEKYDVVIIGAGPAGLAAAYGLKAAGKNVAVIENDLWGGTCPNRGCDPKKVLLSGVEARDKVAQLHGKGFKTAPLVNWVELQAFKETFTTQVSENSRQGLVKAEIQTIEGTPRFIAADQIQVNQAVITADDFIIATGQRPKLLDVPGKDHLLTSSDFLSLKQMPEEIAIIGGGYIAFELASIANATGTKVHVIHHNERPLKAFDADLVADFITELQQKGIIFHFNVATKEIVQKQNRYTLQANNLELPADLIFAATGRIPNLEGLDLAAANVVSDGHGIQVNAQLQTANPHVYAIGDVVAKKQPKLTPVAGFEARYVVQQLTGTTTAAISYPPIPTVVYGSPKLAAVGVTTVEAAQQPDKYKLKTQDLTQWFSYHRTNDSIAKATLIFDKQDLLVGASVLSYEADTLINYLTLAITQKLDHQSLLQLIMAYPTAASDLPYLI
ncbi:dihydrolipoyl dehydrogenase family protein [Agrilactobacillus yilanensis]|uniref:Dihydrolipoyl dehydrogenase family protein n=1 Tax=Agrilactobacillus yilanensis TaxID=2485997 RepID=A0ABW4J6V1_9LACO|nr:NAD(P)/FAD-dependent oxidoreductase [Agrilactobacillus yilanensis]